jgi:hypothetical protein
MTHYRLVGAFFAATVPSLSAGAHYEPHVKAPSSAALEAIGNNPRVKQAFEAELGSDSARNWRNGSAAERGKFALENDSIAARIGSGLGDSEKRHEWAGLVNSYRFVNQGIAGHNSSVNLLTVTERNRTDTFAFHRIPISPEVSRKSVGNDTVGEKTDEGCRISFDPINCAVQFNPSLKIPLWTNKGVPPVEIKSVPLGKVFLVRGDRRCFGSVPILH